MTNRQIDSPPPSVNHLVLRGCLILLLSFAGLLSVQAKTIFVKANASGTNNGTSWANAYTSLQTALASAVSGDEIWVAKGTYKPSPSNVQDPNAFFAMLPNVKIYGSFAGTEANLADRTPSVRAVSVSILSGDLADNDNSGALNANTFNFDNSYNVISNISNGLTNANALLDGFTISGGNTQEFSAGGGMLNVSSSPSIVNVTFTRNYGRNGGGMFNNAAAPSLSNVTFLDNAAGFFGGGMNNIGGATPILNNVTFTNNMASYGGGMNNDNASPSLSKVIFSANRAVLGGGMHNTNAATPSLSNVIFSENGNNYAPFTCVSGGGMCNNSGATPSLNNVTFWNNMANSGGGMYNSSSIPTIKNSIFWNNRLSASSISAISSIEGDAANVTYSDIEQTSGVYAGIGNVNEFPMFALYTPNSIFYRNPAGDDGIFGTADDALALSPCSPAVNTGNNTGVATTDIVGNPRTFGSTVDMGAYELQYNTALGGSRLYVNQAVANSGDGFSWATALKDLPSALALATTCIHITEIWVAKGTYKPTTSTTDRSASFKMIGDVKIYGSFAGIEATLADRSPSVRAANPTILSGDLLDNDVITGSGSTLSITGNAENSYHIFFNNITDLNSVNSNSILDGFIIKGGNAQGFIDSYPSFGGVGGGIYIKYSLGLITRFYPSFSNLTIVGNNAPDGGGGMYSYVMPTVLSNVTFLKNSSGADGGGMMNRDRESFASTVNNVNFIGNNAAGNGGGIKNSGSLSLVNVTFWGNNAGNSGSGMNAGSSETIKNSIFWGNTTGGTTVSSIAGTPTVTYSDVEGGYVGTGNINQDPLFVNAANPAGTDGIFGTSDDGLALTVCSPALNAGNNTGVATTDIVGNPRIFSSMVDMGAYELQAASQYYVAPPTTTNNALNFDGTNDYVQIHKCSGNLFAGGDAITIEYWFKGSSNQSAVRMQDNGQFIVAGWNGTHILSNDGGLTGISAGTGYTDGNWHHIAITWQRSGLFTSYLDGVQVAQRVASNTPLPVFNVGVYLGSLGGIAEFMNGSLDEVRVWTVARTQAQIQTNMSACTILDQTGLLMYYRFDHGAVNGTNTAINTLLNSVNTTELTGVLSGFSLSTTSSNWVTGKSCGLAITAKIFLEGAYNTTTHLMRDDLRSKNLIPIQEPYTGASTFTHYGNGGNEQTSSSVLSVTGNNAIIDWVFIELRDPSVPTTILYTRSALLQADGDIVDVNGVSPLVFNAPANNYYLGIRHRNHLIIQTTAAISLGCNTIISADFSDKIANISTSKMNELDNLKVMRGGDLNNNGDITAFDVSKVRQANITGQSDSYKNEDVNMNGQATAFDVSIVRRNNKPN